ncbi:MAG: ribonuclease HII [Rhodothermales bacterium]|nr:ribonuclease HII [Rhodothermales bacterium]MBO6780606.1 ribonuclease HII [Rhodothermales bacterium]
MLPGLELLPLDGPLPECADDALERAVRDAGYGVVAGVDEVGRGCLAGPVVAAAAILPAGFVLEGLTDSKKMSLEARTAADAALRQQAAVSVGICTVKEIDRWNILRASLQAMQRALQGLGTQPDFLLVDGNQTLPGMSCPQQTVIKGDARCVSIAAASVVAKVARDRMMAELAAEYPEYGWERNVGYGSGEHLDALRRLGPTPHHRRSFRLGIEDQSQTSLF